MPTDDPQAISLQLGAPALAVSISVCADGRQHHSVAVRVTERHETSAQTTVDDPLHGSVSSRAEDSGNSSSASRVDSGSTLAQSPSSASEEPPANLPALAVSLHPAGGLSAVARVERAWRQGLGDARVRDGQRQFSVSWERLQLGPPVVYVILSGCPEAPCVVPRRSRYFQLIGDGDGLCGRAFASSAEATAYCLGAGLTDIAPQA